MQFLGDKPASGQPRATAFVLTDEARTQKYGCAVELPSASGRREDRVAVCCVGRLPLFRQLHATLRYVLGGAACSAEEAARAAHFAVFGVPLPPRGLGAVQLTLGDASWALSRPPLNAHPFLFDDWTLSLPGRLLSPRGCVRLLRALAAESKVVVVAPASHAPALLAPFCTAALAQLWPLRWEHALIPALPDTLPLRSVLEAPCPIFIGASRERLDAVAALGPLPSDVVVVDIGAGTVAPGKRAMASLLPIPADAERELAAVIARLRPHDGTAAAGRGGPAAAAAAEVAAAAAEALQPPDRGQVAGGCGPRSSRLLAASAAVWVPLLRAIDDAFCLRHEAEAAEAARAAATAAAAAGASPARDAAPGGGRSGPSFGPELLGGAHVVLDVGAARAAVKRNSALSAMLEALLQTQALACYCDRRGSVDTDDEMDVRRVAHASPVGADAARVLAMRALLRAMGCTSADCAPAPNRLALPARKLHRPRPRPARAPPALRSAEGPPAPALRHLPPPPPHTNAFSRLHPRSCGFWTRCSTPTAPLTACWPIPGTRLFRRSSPRPPSAVRAPPRPARPPCPSGRSWPLSPTLWRRSPCACHPSRTCSLQSAPLRTRDAPAMRDAR